MEHRHSQRLATGRIKVDVWRNGYYLGRFKTRDISSHGISLLGGELPLYLNDLLELTLPDNGDGRSGGIQVKGIVIHRTDEGGGVMFLDDYPEIVDLIRVTARKAA